MARVPILSSSSVSLSPLARERVTEASSAGVVASGLAAGMDTLGKTLGAVAGMESDAAKRKADRERREAEIALARSAGKILYDPKDGYLATGGKVAIDKLAPTLAGLAEQADDLEKGLTTPYARVLFRQSADARLAEYRTLATRHAATEEIEYDRSLFDAGLDLAGEELVTHGADPELMQINLGKFVDLITAYGADPANGWSPEQTAFRVKKEVSPRLLAIAVAKADVDPDEAESWLEEWRKPMFDRDYQIALGRIDVVRTKRAVAAERANDLRIEREENEEDTALEQVARGQIVDVGLIRQMVERAASRGDTVRAGRLLDAGVTSQTGEAYAEATPERITTRLGQIEGTRNWRRNPVLVAEHRALSSIRDNARNAEPNWPELDFNDPAAVAKRNVEVARWAQGHNGQAMPLGRDQAERLSNMAGGGLESRAAAVELLAKLHGSLSMAAAQQVAPGDKAFAASIGLPPLLIRQVLSGETLLESQQAKIQETTLREYWTKRPGPALAAFPANMTERIKVAARNIYAYRQRGELGFDEQVFYGIVDELLEAGDGGRIGKWNREWLVLPRGMSQVDFDKRVSNIGDPTNLFYADGTPIPKRDFMREYRLIPTGRDGVYEVVDKRGTYARSKPGGGKAELDINRLAMPPLRQKPRPKSPSAIWVAPPRQDDGARTPLWGPAAPQTPAKRTR